MKSKEVIKYFSEKQDNLYMIEFVCSSFSSKEQAIDDFEHLNMSCIDSAKLYKIEKGEVYQMNKIHTQFDEMWQLDLYSIVRTILLSDIFRYFQIQLLKNSDIKLSTLYEFESIKQSKIAMVVNHLQTQGFEIVNDITYEDQVSDLESRIKARDEQIEKLRHNVSQLQKKLNSECIKK